MNIKPIMRPKYYAPHPIRASQILAICTGLLLACAPPTDGTSEGFSSETSTGSSDESLNEKIVQELFTQKCATSSCHSSEAASANLILEGKSFENSTIGVNSTQVTTLLRIEAGDPEASYLMHKVLGTHIEVGGSGARMPLGSSLSVTEVSALEDWILNYEASTSATNDQSMQNQTDCVAIGTEVTGNTVDEDCDGVASDRDRDGFDAIADGGTDADDLDPSVYPDAPEICGDNIDNNQVNGIDENCNLDIDDDSDTYSELEGDCNDSDSSIHPGATEITGNSIDEDCDGYKLDQDGDGFSAEDTGGTDCNDLESSINPGQSEVLGNDADENCDGIFGTGTWTFTDVYSNVINASCSCHSGTSHSTGWFFNNSQATAYANLVNAASSQTTLDRVEPNSSSESYLMHKLDGTHATVDGSGMQMPRGATELPFATRNEIRDWITNGAAND